MIEKRNVRRAHRSVSSNQIAAANASPRGTWVDTDDLNGPKNGLHYNKSGYRILGKRFADAAIGQLKPAKR